jgi:ribose/xylose/arabinose/galactoside ABC-type transport system permease subunit
MSSDRPSQDPAPASPAPASPAPGAGTTAATAATAATPSRTPPALYRYAMLLIFVVLLIGMAIVSPIFRDPANLVNVLQQNAIIGIVACGMLVMIVTGGFDLSVGAVGAMSAIVAAWVFINVSMWLGIGAALVVGIATGLINGLLIAKIGMNPFVATLGMQVLIRGVLLIVTDGKPIYGVPNAFTWVGLGKVGPVPVSVIIWLAVVLATLVILRFSRIGHYVYAVGGNKEAARLAGIDVERVLILVYAFGGLCAAIGGVVMLGQTIIGQPGAAETWPLSAIAAVVVGGVPLSGGSGGVGNVVLGTLLLGTVANALNLLGVSQYWQPAVTGLVILVAVGIDSYQRKRRASR